MNEFGRWLRVVLAALITSAVGSCASSRVETAAPIETTDRGVVTVVRAPLERTAEWTTRAFQDLGIRLNGLESDPDAREYQGTREDLNVRAALRREPPDRTRIEVTARNGEETLDQAYARKILARIARNER